MVSHVELDGLADAHLIRNRDDAALEIQRDDVPHEEVAPAEALLVLVDDHAHEQSPVEQLSFVFIELQRHLLEHRHRHLAPEFQDHVAVGLGHHEWLADWTAPLADDEVDVERPGERESNGPGRASPVIDRQHVVTGLRRSGGHAADHGNCLSRTAASADGRQQPAHRHGKGIRHHHHRSKIISNPQSLSQRRCISRVKGMVRRDEPGMHVDVRKLQRQGGKTRPTLPLFVDAEHRLCGHAQQHSRRQRLAEVLHHLGEGRPVVEAGEDQQHVAVSGQPVVEAVRDLHRRGAGIDVPADGRRGIAAGPSARASARGG